MTESHTTILDQKKLDQLRYWQGKANPELFQKVVRLFLEQMFILSKQLLVFAKQGDNIMVVEVAHTLKSSSATVGAVELADLCEKIESNSMKEKLDMDLIISIQNICKDIDVALKKEMKDFV